MSERQNVRAIRRIGTLLDECRNKNFAVASVSVEDLRGLYAKIVTVPSVGGDNEFVLMRLADAEEEVVTVMADNAGLMRENEQLRAEVGRFCADAERLNALDNFCRRIALHAVKGTEAGGYIFRWQIDYSGRGSPRPSIRDAIDAAIAHESPCDPCPKGDPDCETGDDGSCHDACDG